MTTRKPLPQDLKKHEIRGMTQDNFWELSFVRAFDSKIHTKGYWSPLNNCWLYVYSNRIDNLPRYYKIACLLSSGEHIHYEKLRIVGDFESMKQARNHLLTVINTDLKD